MRGYYVIPTNEEPIEIIGRGSKSKALKIAKDLYQNGDDDVFIQKFDDDNPNGYFANEEQIRIADLQLD